MRNVNIRNFRRSLEDGLLVITPCPSGTECECNESGLLPWTFKRSWENFIFKITTLSLPAVYALVPGLIVGLVVAGFMDDTDTIKVIGLLLLLELPIVIAVDRLLLHVLPVDSYSRLKLQDGLTFFKPAYWWLCEWDLFRYKCCLSDDAWQYSSQGSEVHRNGFTFNRLFLKRGKYRKFSFLRMPHRELAERLTLFSSREKLPEINLRRPVDLENARDLDSPKIFILGSPVCFMFSKVWAWVRMGILFGFSILTSFIIFISQSGLAPVLWPYVLATAVTLISFLFSFWRVDYVQLVSLASSIEQNLG